MLDEYDLPITAIFPIPASFEGGVFNPAHCAEILQLCLQDPAIVAAYQLAQEYHQGQTRKVNGKPYFTHVEGVASLCAVGSGYLEADAQVVTLVSALLHDVRELNRAVSPEEIAYQLAQNGVSEEVIARWKALDVFLTPPSKPPDMSLSDQREGKLQQDAIKWAYKGKDSRPLHIITGADIYQNLKDTLMGMVEGRDGLHTNCPGFSQPFSWRVALFGDRIEQMSALNRTNPFLHPSRKVHKHLVAISGINVVQ